MGCKYKFIYIYADVNVHTIMHTYMQFYATLHIQTLFMCCVTSWFLIYGQPEADRKLNCQTY